jgi:quercetin dioxygenase-like cupin family protein
MRRPALAALAAFLAAAAHAQPPLRSVVIRPDSARSRGTSATGTSRSLMDTVTATLGRLESHVTTLAPGAQSHAPHRHVAEEIIILVRGTLDVYQGDAVKRAPTGSVIFMASNELHAVKNVGADTAMYYVVQPTPKAGAP